MTGAAAGRLLDVVAAGRLRGAFAERPLKQHRRFWSGVMAGYPSAESPTQGPSLLCPLRNRLHERCKQLVELNRQYAGVQLTSAQKQLKKKLVAWYAQNCRTRRANATH